MSNKYYLQLEEELKAEKEGGLEDEEIVLKSLDNPRLFEIFIDRYQETFLRTADRVLNKREEAEEAVQNAFVKIYFNAKKYQKRPGVAFKSWAFKILMNCVFTRYRKIKRGLRDVEYMDQLLYTADKPAEDEFKKKELQDEISSILQEMPPDLSELIKEHYLNDKPYAEIASSKNMTIPALKMKLFRARKKFKDIKENNNY